MDDADAEVAVATPSPLRRRNSIATSVVIPTRFAAATLKPTHSSSLPNGTKSPPVPLDFELISLKSSQAYTSLKDLLPFAAVNSPTSASASASEISIRNRLVKQAAWAYLQPTISPSPGSSGSRFLLRRLWLRFSSCFCSVKLSLFPAIARFFDRILHFFSVPMMRR